jgi:hypothetical protein
MFTGTWGMDFVSSSPLFSTIPPFFKFSYKSFLKITIEGRAIYGNLENKINTLYWPEENSIPKNNDAHRDL